MPGAADAPSAYVQYTCLAPSALPATISSGSDWCIAMWIKPAALTENRSVFQLSASGAPTRSALHITTDNAGRDVRVALFDSAGSEIASRSTAAASGETRPISTDFPSWTLAIVWHDSVTASHANLGVVAVNSVGQLFDAGSTTYSPSIAQLAAFDRVRVGRPTTSGAIDQGMTGEYGPLVVRNHAASASDAATLWSTRSAGGLLNRSGGNWNSVAGARWGIFNVYASHLFDQDSGAPEQGLPLEFSTEHLLSPSNCVILDTARPEAGWLDIHTARTVVSGSWRIGGVDAFFPLGTPSFAGVTGRSVRGPAETFRQLASGSVSDVRRLLVLSNSRGVRYSTDIRSDVGAWSQHWGGGLALAALDLVSGSTAVKPTVNADNAEVGLDYARITRATSGAGNTVSTRALRRFGYGSQLAGSSLGSGRWTGGPGAGVLINQSGTYQTLTHEVPGSRYLFDRPRRYRALVLAYPGSADARIDMRSSEVSQSDPNATLRSEGSWTQLDTTRLSGVVVSTSSAARTITIAGTGLDIEPGDAISVGASLTTVDASVIASIEEVGSNTRLTLEHWLDPTLTPAPGAQVRIGSWQLLWIDTECSGDEPWSTEPWQGFRLCAGETGAPLCLLSEEWQASGPGFVIGSSGWSGHGYSDHLANAFMTTRPSDGKSPFVEFLRLMDPDCVALVPAQQSSLPSVMGTMTSFVREHIDPATEVVWIADHTHGRSTTVASPNSLSNQNFGAWYAWMEANAKANGVPYLARGMTALGNFEDQLARGWRSNSVSHDTSEGCLVWARAVLEDARRSIIPAATSTSSKIPDVTPIEAK